MKDFELLNINLQLFAEDEDDDNPLANFLANFDDFVNGDDDTDEDYSYADEPEEETEEELEDESEDLEEETKEEQTDTKAKTKQTSQPKKQLSKQEYALVQAKKENKSLKELLKSMNDRLANIEKTETERNLEGRKHKLIATYIDKGYDEETAMEMASDKIEKELLKNDVDTLRKQLEELAKGKESLFDTKTNAEQALLYKQAKAQKSKVEAGTAGSTTANESFKMTTEQKRDWEALQKTPWGKGLSKKEFLKSWNESFR